MSSLVECMYHCMNSRNYIQHAHVICFPNAGYQPTQNSFLQTNGPAYQTSQPPAASPLLNGGNTPRTNATVNGAIDYVDASPRPTEFMNGAYPGQVRFFTPCQNHPEKL